MWKLQWKIEFCWSSVYSGYNFSGMSVTAYLYICSMNPNLLNPIKFTACMTGKGTRVDQSYEANYEKRNYMVSIFILFLKILLASLQKPWEPQMYQKRVSVDLMTECHLTDGWFTALKILKPLSITKFLHNMALLIHADFCFLPNSYTRQIYNIKTVVFWDKSLAAHV